MDRDCADPSGDDPDPLVCQHIYFYAALNKLKSLSGLEPVDNSFSFNAKNTVLSSQEELNSRHSIVSAFEEQLISPLVYPFS